MSYPATVQYHWEEVWPACVWEQQNQAGDVQHFRLWATGMQSNGASQCADDQVLLDVRSRVMPSATFTCTMLVVIVSLHMSLWGPVQVNDTRQVPGTLFGHVVWECSISYAAPTDFLIDHPSS